MKKRAGVSLIELVIVIAIISVTGYAFANFIQYGNSVKRASAVQEVVQLVQKAHSYARANTVPDTCATLDNYAGHGVTMSGSTMHLVGVCGASLSGTPEAIPIEDYAPFSISLGTKYPDVTVSMEPTALYFNKYSASTYPQTGGVIYVRPVTPTGRHTEITILPSGQITTSEEDDE